MRVIDSILDFPKGDWGEDRLFIGDKSIGVIDGATPISATPLKGYHSQAEWLADKLAKGLKTCPFVFIPHACMCKHWGISKNAYYRRLSRGWSLEKALSSPIKRVRKSKSYVDFNGNVFTSVSSLAKEYGVSFRVITRLLDKGKTAEEITHFLSKRTKGEFMYEDHLGNKYPTYSKMAEAYGINTRLFATRRNRGWTIEEALTKPSKVKKNSNSQK